LSLLAQEWSIPTSRKSKKDGRRPVGMNMELVAKRRQKKEVYRRWKQGQVIQEEYRDAA